MDIFNLAVFRMAQMKMQWVGQRQALIAENIANANTPGYQAKDLKALDFKALAEQAITPQPALAVTNPDHIQIPTTEGPYPGEVNKHTFSTSLNGNPVSVQEEMQKVSDDRMDYNYALNLVRKNLQMLKMATGNGGGSA